MAKFCNKCNSPIEDGGYFCTECGSNDIRDDKESSQQKEEKVQEKIELPTPEDMNSLNESIPEIEINTVTSFGDKSIEQLKKSNIKPISNSKNYIEKDPEESITQNSFSNIPDYMIKNMEKESPPQKQNIKTNNYEEEFNTKIEESPTKTTHYVPIQKKKKGNIILKIIIGIVVLVVIGGLIIFIFSPEKESSPTIPQQQNIEVDYSKIFTPENSVRMGNEKTGYISIPNTWKQVIQQPGSDVQQYTDGNWVVTLMSADTSKYSAETYANSVYNSIKQGGGQNIKTGKSKIAGYTALIITASYPDLNKYLTTWCFESKIGQTHYLAIEGPESSGYNYNIIYSFKENQ